MLPIAFMRNGLPLQIIFPNWLRNLRKAQDLSLISLSGISLAWVLTLRETLLPRKLSELSQTAWQRLCADVWSAEMILFLGELVHVRELFWAILILVMGMCLENAIFVYYHSWLFVTFSCLVVIKCMIVFHWYKKKKNPTVHVLYSNSTSRNVVVLINVSLWNWDEGVFIYGSTVTKYRPIHLWFPFICAFSFCGCSLRLAILMKTKISPLEKSSCPTPISNQGCFPHRFKTSLVSPEPWKPSRMENSGLCCSLFLMPGWSTRMAWIFSLLSHMQCCLNSITSEWLHFVDLSWVIYEESPGVA